MKRQPRTSGAVVAAVLVAATTGFLALSPQTPVQAAAPMSLARRSVVSGEKTAALKLRIPRTTTIDLRDETSGVRIEGAGRIYGFILTSANVADSDRPIVVALETKVCSEKDGCIRRSIRTFSRGETSGPVAKLPRGDYILYLVADGEPVTARISATGLEGSAAFRPRLPVHSGIEDPAAHIEEATNTIYSNGRSVDFRGESAMWMTLLSMSGDAWVAGAYGHCIYRGDPPPPPGGFAPGCPSGGGAAIADVVVQPVPYEKYGGSLTFATPGGRWAFGDYYVSAAKAAPPKTLSFFLDFERI